MDPWVKARTPEAGQQTDLEKGRRGHSILVANTDFTNSYDNDNMDREGADYGFNQTHHTGDRRRCDGRGAARV